VTFLSKHMQDYHEFKFEKNEDGVVMMSGKFRANDSEFVNPINIMRSYPERTERPGVVVPISLTAEPVARVRSSEQ
jgi:hypothetical protein